MPALSSAKTLSTERGIMIKAFLIKYAEIGLKGKNRYLFENALKDRISASLRKCEGNFIVKKEQGRIFVEAISEFDYEETVEAIQKVFGVFGICPVLVIEDKSFENICEEAAKYIKEEYGDRELTFKVFAKRGDKQYPILSPDICAKLGEYIIEKCPNMKVDLHQPQEKIYIEVRNKAYVYFKIIQGPGGMPVGTNGKAMLLLSGGIDSPVAGYMIAKRGVAIDAVYFHAPPYTSERAKQKVVDLAKIISEYTGHIRLHIIHFTDIQMAIYERCPHDELTIIMRRYMMRIAESLAKASNCLGLITGESIGQVASQTLHSLLATNDVCELPVYRPVIAFDKQEIVDISMRIQAYETSILPYEDCCTIFVAKHPVTKPNIKVIRGSELRLQDDIEELIAKAIETDEIVEI